MTVYEMNKILKEMKDVIKFKESETEIWVENSNNNFKCVEDFVRLETKINNIEIVMIKQLKE